jgi:hypothetical protein
MTKQFTDIGQDHTQNTRREILSRGNPNSTELASSRHVEHKQFPPKPNPHAPKL